MQPVMREKMAPMQDPGYGQWAVGRLSRTVDHLAAYDGVGDRLGVMGFCFGGSYSFALAAADARIKVAIPFYGSPPDQSSLAAIGGPVLAFYGETDERLITGLPAVREQMAAAGVDFTAQVYPGGRARLLQRHQPAHVRRRHSSRCLGPHPGAAGTHALTASLGKPRSALRCAKDPSFVTFGETKSVFHRTLLHSGPRSVGVGCECARDV